jgi:dipeptidase
MIRQFLYYIMFLFILSDVTAAQGKSSIENYSDRSDGCTTITVGKKASFDGSVMTSHTMDGHRDRVWVDIIPAKDHPAGAKKTIMKRVDIDTTAMPSHLWHPAGEIPEAAHTYGYVNTTVRCINDQQLAMGESTFGGRSSLSSEAGLIQYEVLSELLLERCRTAREAIKVADELTKEYGWCGGGEVFTIIDTKEVWHLEIIGPGIGKIGAIWAAQRIPDDHVSVNANASRIRQIDLDNPEYFMASENIFKVAQDSGWWNPDNGPFEFCYAYDPDGRNSMASRRREWRALSLLAPSLDLKPNAENYPFSIKPDTAVTLDKMVEIFQDYYEGTDFNPVKNITWQNPETKAYEISPLANPFMPYDMNPLFKINGGWGGLGERTIARWYTQYATIIQCRDWLPNPIGGVVWLAWENVATAVYTPIYCANRDVPESFKVHARITGYKRDSAWWAFNRLSTLTAQRWGDMRKDVEAVWQPMQRSLFVNQNKIEAKALRIYNKDPEEAIKFLTEYSIEQAQKAVENAWKLGDFLWTKYDEKF